MQEQEKQTLVINVNLTRGLVALLTLALLTAAFLGYLAWGQREVVASSPQAPTAGSTGLRQYYRTMSTYDGSAADTACAPDYHMASLWEILDPSNLKYNATLGWTNDDSGQGPPASYVGWVRTGWSSSSSSMAGLGNCESWSSNSNSDYGTYVSLPGDWAVAQDIGVWDANTRTCEYPMSVWCVED